MKFTTQLSYYNYLTIEVNSLQTDAIILGLSAIVRIKAGLNKNYLFLVKQIYVKSTFKAFSLKVFTSTVPPLQQH